MTKEHVSMPHRVSSKAKLIAYSAVLSVALASLIGLDYVLPEKTNAYVTGVEVKRVDKDGPISAENPADGPTHDAYFIYTSLSGPGTEPSDQVRVFINEDTGWHWPPYFKFNSADVQAKAQTLSKNNAEVTITSYGWRINILSMFPNVLAIEASKDVVVPVSLIRSVALFIWFLLMVKSLLLCRRLLKRRESRA
jgi:hypothetical protein